jgi:hypothetical protein
MFVLEVVKKNWGPKELGSETNCSLPLILAAHGQRADAHARFLLHHDAAASQRLLQDGEIGQKE